MVAWISLKVDSIISDPIQIDKAVVYLFTVTKTFIHENYSIFTHYRVVICCYDRDNIEIIDWYN